MPEENGSQEFRRRLPSVLRKVSDISGEDIRVSLIGTVIDSADDGIVLDDGTGKIDVTLNEKPAVSSGGLARVFGRVVPMENGFQLQGEIVQDMSGLDMELLNKVLKVKE
jgi:hypothetical protein